MSADPRKPEPRPQLELADYGIDINNPTWCPKCRRTGVLTLSPTLDSWHCTCGWTWSMRRERGEKLILDAMEVAPAMPRWFDNGIPEGLSMGWPALDEYLKIRRGEWTLVTGWAAHGKSQFMDAVVVNMAFQHDWRFAIFSPENVPYEQHVRGLLQKVVGKRFKPKDPAAPAMEREEMLLAWRWLKSKIFFIDAVEPTFETILAQFARAVRQHDVQSIIIDPWNELEHDRPYGMSETDYTGQVLIRFRDFCKQHHVHGWIVAHPSKMALTSMTRKKEKDEDAGARPVVRLMDVSGSAHWENKPFNGLSIWRNPAAAEAYERNLNGVYVLKQRTEGLGKVGKVVLDWDPETTCYQWSNEISRNSVFPIDELKKRADKASGGLGWREVAKRAEDNWFLRERPLPWIQLPKDKSHFTAEYRVELENGQHIGSVWRAESEPGRFQWWAGYEDKHLKHSDLTTMDTREAAFSWAEHNLMMLPAPPATTQGDQAL